MSTITRHAQKLRTSYCRPYTCERCCGGCRSTYTRTRQAIVWSFFFTPPPRAQVEVRSHNAMLS